MSKKPLCGTCHAISPTWLIHVTGIYRAVSRTATDTKCSRILSLSCPGLDSSLGRLFGDKVDGHIPPNNSDGAGMYANHTAHYNQSITPLSITIKEVIHQLVKTE